LKNNTYSLLNTPWMIDDAAATSLIPGLVSLLKSKKFPKATASFPVVYFNCDDDDDDCDDDNDYDNDLSELEEINVSSENKYVAVLPIKGAIFKYDQECGPKGTQTMITILNQWKFNDSVTGVILDIDSGGGQVSGTRELREVIKNYPKPIVVYSNGSIGSAAYWLASASKYIVLNENADFTGSIGAMLKYVNLDGILTNAGATIKDIYATNSKQKNQEVRAMIDKEDPSLLIKNILDPLRDTFVADVQLSRPNLNSDVFQGAVYFPAEAITMNLVDQLGTMRDAFNKVISLSTPKNNNINSNSNNMKTKAMPLLQAVLSLDAPLAITDKGVFLNEEQLESVEGRLSALEGSEATLTTQLEEAKKNPELQGKLTTATTALTTVESSIDTMLEVAGLSVEGSLTEKITALNVKVTEMSKQPGDVHTKPRVEKKDPEAVAPEYVDANAEHNQLANQMFK
jgi:protease-4